MEGGGTLQHRNYSRDHLATTRIVTESHVDENKWLASGFNEFGQLVTFEDKRKLKQFEEFKTCCRHSSQPLLSCSWSYMAVANKCSLQLQGLVCGYPKTMKSLITETVIKSLASCDRFCLVLLDNGTVYKLFPQQFDIQLEEVKFQANQKPVLPQKRSLFGTNKADADTGVKIDLVACGNNIMVAIGNSNEIFSGTTQILQFPRHIRLKQLTCGFEHALLLTSNGDVYSWGNGLRGQLGQEILKVEERPMILEALAGIKITYIASSGWHSAAISAFGDIYTWGFNSNGQLGVRVYKSAECTLKEPSVFPLPQLIDLPHCRCSQSINKCQSYKQKCFPIKVEAGSRHTILLMNCGSLYATGWNAYGQLGLKNIKSFSDSFQYVLNVENTNADAIELVCGSWCTLIGIQSGNLSCN